MNQNVYRSQQIPAYTVLEEHTEEPATWENAYKSNFMSAPPNTPISDYDVMNADSNAREMLGLHESREPKISQGYHNSIINNAAVSKKNLRFNIPNEATYPLPRDISLPYFNAPYSYPYPTDGYSPFDGALAMNANVPQFYGHAGVPIASNPALEDARNSPAVPMGPQTLAVIAENHWKEGWKAGREGYEPNCSEHIHHAMSCPLCIHYIRGDLKFYKISVLFLFILLVVLIILLYKKN